MVPEKRKAAAAAGVRSWRRTGDFLSGHGVNVPARDHEVAAAQFAAARLEEPTDQLFHDVPDADATELDRLAMGTAG